MWLGNVAKASNKSFWTDTSQFNEDFIKIYKEESDEGYFLDVDVQYPEKLHELQNGLLFLPERIKLKNLKSLLLIYMIKLNMSFT